MPHLCKRGRLQGRGMWRELQTESSQLQVLTPPLAVVALVNLNEAPAVCPAQNQGFRPHPDGVGSLMTSALGGAGRASQLCVVVAGTQTDAGDQDLHEHGPFGQGLG